MPSFETSRPRGARKSSRSKSALTRRDRLKEALRLLGGGDTLLVRKPDRLARSTPDLLRIVGDLDRCGVVTAKSNDVDPRAWLAEVLRRIADHSAHQRHELPRWTCPEPRAEAAAS